MMGRKARLVTIALALVIGVRLLDTSPAHADGATKAEARKLLEVGDRHIRRGERLQRRGRGESATRAFQQALESYEKAYELVPNPSIFFAIAGAEEKLERWLDAVEHYRKVVREADSETLRMQGAQRITALERHVAVAVFVVQPEGAEISIDRELQGQAPLDGPVYLEPGDYRVTVTAPGYTPYEAEITVEAGKQDERVIELSKPPVVFKKPKPMPMARGADQGEKGSNALPAPPGKAAVVVGATLTGALLAGAATTGYIALSKHRTFQEATGDERAAASETGKTMALATDGLLAGAFVVGAYTTYRYFLVYRPARAAYESQRAAGELPPGRTMRAPRRSWWAMPYVAPAGGGLAVGGRF